MRLCEAGEAVGHGLVLSAAAPGRCAEGLLAHDGQHAALAEAHALAHVADGAKGELRRHACVLAVQTLHRGDGLGGPAQAAAVVEHGPGLHERL